MQYGFTYRGKHSKDFGLVVKTKKRPVLPPMRENELTVPYRDGAYDYSAAGGRVFYEDGLVEVELTVIKPELKLTHTQIAKIVSWLSGWYDELIFDDMPETIWNARPIEMGDISLSLYRIGSFTVQFRCKPFNKSNIGFGDAATLEADVVVGSNMAIGFLDGIKYEDVQSSLNTVILYQGDAPARPVFEFLGEDGVSGSYLKLSLNGYSLSYVGSFASLIIDCVNWTAKADNVDVTAVVSGDYPELVPGENKLVLETDYDGSLKINTDVNFLYGYGGDELD